LAVGDGAEVGTLGKLLAEEAAGALVEGALPGAARIADVVERSSSALPLIADA
jgi:hypothetical protein